ncbi:hypothetical protein MHTCC0001_13160 [Flavobacteriaceae bacterium MHTCC 0001]
MNYFSKLKSISFILLAAFFITSCSTDSNDDILIGDDDMEDKFDGELSVFDTGGDNRTVSINGATVKGTDGNALVKVAFKSANSMRRLYVTQNVSDFGAEPYNFAVTGVTVDDKKDGSLDLSGDNKNSFEFQIPFPVPTSADSKILYTIWATTGRGDFRDISKRNAIDDTAVGTITITGSGSAAGTGINSFQKTLLAAPLADGSSSTFLSLFDNQVYKISEGEEFAALWDFGFYYLNSTGASLASTSAYPELFDHDNDSATGLVAVSVLTGVDQTELNQFYFAKSTKSVTDFENATLADLNAISKPTAEEVNNLAIDDIVEFQDQYGNKGLIRILDKKDSFGSDGFISFDVKVTY